MAIVNELVTKFSYQGSTAPIASYTKSLDGAFTALSKLTAVAAVAVAGISAMVMKTVDNADALGDLSQRTNISTDSLQTLGYVAQLNGSSFEAMNSSLEGLNRQIGLAASGGTAQQEVFKQLGIAIKDSSGNIKAADTVFMEMQKRMKELGYGTQQTAGVLRQLRLDPTMAQTLNLTTEEMAKFTKEARDAGIMSKEQIEAAAEFNDNLDRMKFRLMSLGNQLMLNLMPAMSKMMEGVEVIIFSIKGFIESIFQLGRSLFTAIDSTVGFGNGMVVLGGIVAWFARGALMNLIIGMKALTVVMLKNPITWIIMGITALILVIDDLVMAFTGGESAIGDFFAEFDIDIVNTLIDGFNMLIRLLSPIGLAFIGFGLIITGVAKTTAQFLNMFGAGIDMSGIDAMGKKLSEQSLSMQSIALGTSQVVANRAAYIPTAPTPTAGASSMLTNNTQNTINITGVREPDKVAQLVGNELQKQNRAAATQRGNGGL